MVSYGSKRGLRYDFFLITVILLLTLLGLVTLFSASYLFTLNQPSRFPRGGLTLLSGNLTALIIMGAGFPILVLMKFEWLKKGGLVVFMVLLTLALNVLPLLKPFQGNGYAMRWIVLRESITFQPSELIKVVLPLYLAYILDKNNDKLGSVFYGPLPPFIVTLLFCVLVFLQNNLSDVFLIALISLAVCFAAGINMRPLFIILAVISVTAYMLILSDKEGHWYQRILSFISNEASPPELKTQIDFSLEAIKSGGFWGKGVGQGTLKIRMPEVHGDFIFASYVEESGFVGVLTYLALFGVFAGLSYQIAWRSGSRFARLLAFGLVTPITAQTLLNIAVVARIVPTTGIPLPFVSSGGSSLLVTLMSAALLVNIARHHINSEISGGNNAG